MKKGFLFVLLLVLAVISGCATHQMNMLNLSYTPDSHKPKTDIKVAVVKPKYTAAHKVEQQFSNSLFGSMMESKMPPDFALKTKYNRDYSVRIEDAMKTDMEKILSAKGFSVSKSYDNTDEITYAEKKNISLIVEPEFDMSPIIRNEHSCLPVIGCSDKGSVSLTGSVKFVALEPMSKEKIVIKTVDLSSLGMATAVDYVGTNNADDTLVNMLNSTYPLLLAKIDKIIDADEINQSLSDIQKLKQKSQ